MGLRRGLGTNGKAFDVVLKPVAGPCANDPGPSVTADANFMAAGVTGPTTEAGLARLTEAKIKHGSSPKRNGRRQALEQQGRQMRAN